MLNYDYKSWEEIEAQINELHKQLHDELDMRKNIQRLREVFLNQRNSLDYRYVAVNYLYDLVEGFPKQVDPIFVEFLQSGETYRDDPNHQKAVYQEMMDPYNMLDMGYDEYGFDDLKEYALLGLQLVPLEARDVTMELVNILLYDFDNTYTKYTTKILLAMGKHCQDIRYLLHLFLLEECEYFEQAKNIIDTLDEWYNQLNQI